LWSLAGKKVFKNHCKTSNPHRALPSLILLIR
jgi:hypothetical protein